MGCTQSTTAGDGGLLATEHVMKNGRRGIDKSERIHSASERAKLVLGRASAIKSANSQDPILPPSPKLNEAGQLVAEEVVKRISGSVETKDVVLGELKSGKDEGLVHVQYAALTQRGYYPDKPHKENQDAYYICPSKFASGEGDAFFAIFDGHGDLGHDCARFAKKNLHVYLAQNVKKQRAAANAARLRDMGANGEAKPKNAFHPSSWPYLDVKAYEKCCRAAHLQCNKAMHDDHTVRYMKVFVASFFLWSYSFVCFGKILWLTYVSYLMTIGKRLHEWHNINLCRLSCWKNDHIKCR